MGADTFTLDTSGFVEGPPQGIRTKRIYWTDLSPFVQGYVEALFAELLAGFSHYERTTALAGFRHLSPEALALILKDCEWLEGGYRVIGIAPDTEMGRNAWKLRQTGMFPNRPPLHITLNNEGKVCPSPTGGGR